MKIFALVDEISRGNPDLGTSSYAGRVHCESTGGKGLYILSGTTPQINTLNLLPQVLGIVAVTQNGARWPELDNAIDPSIRGRLNAWLTGKGKPTVPLGQQNRQTVQNVYKNLNPHWDVSTEDVTE